MGASGDATGLEREMRVRAGACESKHSKRAVDLSERHAGRNVGADFH